MNFDNIQLINVNESKELFLLQEKILNNINNENNSLLDILKLAILQTIPPIGDFENAEKILSVAFCKYKDFSLCIIGSYLCSKWCFDKSKDCYLEYLKENYINYSSKQKAIIEYLIALNLLKKDFSKEAVVYHLKKSLNLSNDLKNSKRLLNYFQEGKFDSDDDYKNNSTHCIEENINPQKFINLFIE